MRPRRPSRLWYLPSAATGVVGFNCLGGNVFLKTIAAVLVAAAACAVTDQAYAQSSSLVLEANGAEVSDVTGAEVGIGWRFNAGNFHLTPAVGGFVYQGDNDRYQMYDQINGSRCRDTTNGQYAKEELCDNTAVDAYGRIEATVSWRKLEFGAGYRVADIDSALYGTVALRVTDGVAIKGNFGSDYIGVGVAVRSW